MLLTPETKDKLLISVETRLNELSFEVENLADLFNKLEAYRIFLESREILNPFENLKNLLNFRIIVGIINLDLCVATLTYLRGKFQYESVSASRQMVVVINEGYKKIYNFILTNKKGDEDLKYRKESFWVNDIGKIVNSELPELKCQYENLTKKLDNYLNVNFGILKIQRDLSIHYDKNSMNVYNMISELDIEESFSKLIPFLDILHDLFIFTQQIANGFQQKVEQANSEQDKRIDSIVNLINSHKSAENEKIVTEFAEKILSLKKLYRK